MSEETKLNALLNIYDKIWEDIKFYQKRGDDAPYLGMMLLASLLGLQFFTDLLSSDLGLFITLLSVVIPFVLLLALQRGGHDNNFVAVLRGYASYLEDEINLLLGKKLFLFNSEYVDKYIRSMNISKKSRFKTTWLITGIGNMFPIIVCIIIFVINNANNWTYIIAATAYYLIIIILCCICLRDFFKKEDKRTEGRYFPHELENNCSDK
jgi:hypothetical protein